ncbi:MAG: hypothetical protein K0S29_893, partial [Gammaproteobacteria bacterium]|nr:hypothetical protein [Gammaproteobacteria bacterium]
MWERARYTLKQAVKHSQNLKDICHSKIWQAPRVIDIDLEALKAQGIKLITLDFDG